MFLFLGTVFSDNATQVERTREREMKPGSGCSTVERKPIHFFFSDQLMQGKAVCEAVLIKIPIVVGTFLTTNHSTSPIRKQLNLSEQLKVMSS